VEKQSALQAFLSLEEIKIPPAVRATEMIKIRMIRSLTMVKDMKLTNGFNQFGLSLSRSIATTKVGFYANTTLVCRLCLMEFINLIQLFNKKNNYGNT
jgi:hypothetical protein